MLDRQPAEAGIQLHVAEREALQRGGDALYLALQPSTTLPPLPDAQLG